MTRSINARLRRLEERWRVKPPSHHVSVVRYPFDCDDRARWIREALPCACGVIGCELMTIGYFGPQKAASAEEWSHAAQAYYVQRGNHA